MLASSSPSVKTDSQSKTQRALPWNVIVLDDPVNLMQYVTMVLKRVFGYSHDKAERMMMEVHTQGRSVVWSGEREKAEFYAQQLHGWQLRASLEKAS